MSILPAVLKAAELGFACFPVDQDDKRPLKHAGRRIEWGEHATTDSETLTAWFTRFPDANYGIAAKPSNLLIVDCDMGRDPKTDERVKLPPRFEVPGVECGEDLFAEMTIQFGEPFPFDTMTVRTPKGGAHYYFANVTGELMTQSPIMKHWIDVRSNGGEYGGYVVGPGSTIHDRPYHIVTPPPVAPAPEWLINLCRYREPAPVSPTRPRPPAWKSPGGTGKLQPLLDSFRNSAPGNQANTLYWAACSAAKDGISLSEAIDGFYSNTPAPSAAPWTQRDIESQVRSAYRGMHVA